VASWHTLLIMAASILGHAHATTVGTTKLFPCLASPHIPQADSRNVSKQRTPRLRETSTVAGLLKQYPKQNLKVPQDSAAGVEDGGLS
jgi:hypothetical protein